MAVLCQNMKFVFACCFLCTLLKITAGVVPAYLPLSSPNVDKASLIEEYFKQGFKYSEILGFLLLKHGILLSLRQLKRILKKLNLKRRGVHLQSQLKNVVRVIGTEMHYSGQSVGYRTIWRRLKVNHNMDVSHKDVMDIMKAIDPNGVEMRKAHRLKRRFYCAKGPNNIWHLDGYDKLKPFGFCIHGAVDGFSRKVIWLEVSDTNNDPKLIAKYYLDALKGIEKHLAYFVAMLEQKTVLFVFYSSSFGMKQPTTLLVIAKSTSN